MPYNFQKHENQSTRANTAAIGLGIAAILAGCIPGGQGFAAVLGAAAATAGATAGSISTRTSVAAMKAGYKGAKASLGMSAGEIALSALTMGGGSLIGSSSEFATQVGLGITKASAAVGFAGSAYGVGSTIDQLATGKMQAKGNVENLFNTFAGAGLGAYTFGTTMVGSVFVGAADSSRNLTTELYTQVNAPADIISEPVYGNVVRDSSISSPDKDYDVSRYLIDRPRKAESYWEWWRKKQPIYK